MESLKIPKLYVLKDPTSMEIRYVGITIRPLQERLAGHLNDVRNRPDVNYHKVNWIRKILSENKKPVIELVSEFDTLEEVKQAEIDYIAKYKALYKLTNCTIGGDHLGERSHSREAILKKSTTRSVDQYNIFGEFLRSFEMTEDAARHLKLSSASKITSCCRKDRKHAHGYIWRYKGEELGDISDIDRYSLCFNTLVQYTLDGEVVELYDSYLTASKAVGDNSKGGNIAATCRGKQRQCKGFLWKLEPNFEYLDESLIDKEEVVKIRERNKTKGISVSQYDLSKNLIATYISVSEACRAVYGNTHRRKQITDCCNKGNFSQYDNYIWQYCPVEE